MSLAAGLKLGPYELIAPIGKGGMGEVYRARDTRLGRDVAIKICGERVSDRFEREAHVVASLNHPNICHLYDVGPNYLVMELIEGQILKGPLPLETALNYAGQIADALEAAHEKGIVHRDLKPANIKITREGVVKVLDFGLAKAAEETGDSVDPDKSPTVVTSQTHAGVILGTAAYMSPEQARGAAVDKRADIWAFGCVLYEMLTGKPAFEGETISDVLAAVIRDEPDWSKIPASVQRLLRRCLVKDPKHRLRDIGDAMGLLETVPEPTPMRSGRWPLIVAALAIALTTVAVLGWWRATRTTGHPLVRMSAELTPGPEPYSFRLDSETMLGLQQPGTFLALSPDGTRLAVSVRDTDGKIRLATRRLDQSQFEVLPGVEDPGSRFFSPDGQWIAFFAAGRLQKASVRGGAPVTLCDAEAMASGSWGDDGNIIAALSASSGLSRIPSGGGTPAPITELDKQKGELGHRWPQVLPGSQGVLFTVLTGGPENSNIEVLSLKTHERKTLTRGGAMGRYLAASKTAGYLLYLHQNTLLAAPFDSDHLAVTGEPQSVLDDVSALGATDWGDFDFSQTGTLVYISGKGEPPRSIFWMNMAGKTEPLNPAPGFYNCLRFSPDGKRLAFATDSGSGPGPADLWMRDLQHDNTVRLTSMPGTNDLPVWTPDGNSIVFLSTNQPNPGFYSIRADGLGGPQRLAETQKYGFPYSISSNGKWLAFQRGNPHAAATEIWTASVEGSSGSPRLGRAKPLVQASGFVVPAFSPDGHWLAYCSNETGTMEVYVRPFQGANGNLGGKWRISSNGGLFPVWSRNGRELFFLAPDRHIMVVDYKAFGDSFSSSKPKLWSEKRILFSHGPFPPYDLAPDGNRFAVLLYPDSTAEQRRTLHLTFLFNFFDELKRRVPVGR